MRIAHPLDEADGRLHPRAAAPSRRPGLTGADLRAIDARAHALRREALSGLLARVGRWLESMLHPTDPVSTSTCRSYASR